MSEWQDPFDEKPNPLKIILLVMILVVNVGFGIATAVRLWFGI